MPIVSVYTDESSQKHRNGPVALIVGVLSLLGNLQGYQGQVRPKEIHGRADNGLQRRPARGITRMVADPDERVEELMGTVGRLVAR